MSHKNSVLTIEEQEKIENLIQKLEEQTGAEFVVAILKQSDPYPGAPLRIAFVFTIISNYIFNIFYQLNGPVFTTLFIIIVFILGNILGHIPFIKKLALTSKEVEREVDEKAIEIFHHQGLENTADRVGCLLIISLFEKKLRFLVDKKLDEKFSQEDLKHLMKILEKDFKENDFYSGLTRAIKDLQDKIIHFFPNKCTQNVNNEISNKILWLD